MDAERFDPVVDYEIAGDGSPPLVFIHGFACDRRDWANQVRFFSQEHRTVVLDLRGHGKSPGTPEDCTIERCGADVADLLDYLDLRGALLVGHSLGCRVAVEAAIRSGSRTAGLVLIDGSQYTADMAEILRGRFATSAGYAAHVASSFTSMFTTKTDPDAARSIVERAERLPRPIGKALLLDCCRYDLERLAGALARLDKPVLAIQATGRLGVSRVTLQQGETTPYLDMLQSLVKRLRVAIIADTGHFPQIDEAGQVNQLTTMLCVSDPM